MNEFKFFKGRTIINNNTSLFQTAGGLEYYNIIGEVVNSASDLENRVRELEQELRFMRDHVNVILQNPTNNL
jgi:hypothetical protein